MSGYPKNLIPKKNYPILSGNELNDRMVARWHDPSQAGSIFDADGNIDASLIFYRRFAGLSCNLKPPSTCDDLKINILNADLEVEWTVGTTPPEIKESDYEKIPEREVYEFRFTDIESSNLPYVIDDTTYNLTVNIVHKPTLANYSHCEFELRPNHPNSASHLKKLSKSKPAYHRIIITSIRRLMELYCKKCS